MVSFGEIHTIGPGPTDEFCSNHASAMWLWIVLSVCGRLLFLSNVKAIAPMLHFVFELVCLVCFFVLGVFVFRGLDFITQRELVPLCVATIWVSFPVRHNAMACFVVVRDVGTPCDRFPCSTVVACRSL